MQHQTDDDRSLAATIARALAARIVTGDLAPGDRLRQDEIAGAFRTSHVPVREAFRRLEGAGLVVSEPRRGVRVAPLDPAGVLEVARMRAALEALALRHALPLLSGEDLASARLAIAAGAASADIVAWEEANRRFHMALLAPCGMPRLVAAIADLHSASARHLQATWRRLGWKPRSDDEHLAILAAIEARRAAAAEELLQRHILAAGEALAGALRAGD